MKNPAPSSASAEADPELVGDHPALDLLNTIARVDGGLVDVWQSDDDVLRWLVRTELMEAKVACRRGEARYWLPPGGCARSPVFW